MSAHTPGPWEWYSHAPWSVWCGNIQIAACRVMEEQRCGGHIAPFFERNDDRTAANARLIAAAPAMLEALEELVAYAESIEGVPGEGFARARHAIRVAKGGTV